MSPPARGRGLKLVQRLGGKGGVDVAPRAGAWIETPSQANPHSHRESPPARGRGLKLRVVVGDALLAGVAPRAGAWIETGATGRVENLPGVAPRAGAWIETTRASASYRKSVRSPPARGRGLKHDGVLHADRTHESPPARGRGLKHPGDYRSRRHPDRRSPPARGRGLKRLVVDPVASDVEVAPRAGAWIETSARP